MDEHRYSQLLQSLINYYRLQSIDFINKNIIELHQFATPGVFTRKASLGAPDSFRAV